jgi:hypothetical protein
VALLPEGVRELAAHTGINIGHASRIENGK